MLYLIIGLCSICESTFFLINKRYFNFVPYVDKVAYTNVIGITGILLGILLISMDLNKKTAKSIYLIVFACGFFAFIGSTATVQIYFPNYNSYTKIVALTNFLLLIMSFSLAKVEKVK